MADFYLSQVEPKSATGALRPASARAFGADLGQAVINASDEVGDAVKRARELEEQREADVEATRLGRELAQIEHLEAPEQIEELRGSSPADGTGHAARVEAALQPRFQALAESVTSERNREPFARLMDQAQTRLAARERGWAQGQRATSQAANAGEMARVLAEASAREFNHQQMMGSLYTIGTVGATMTALPETLRDRFVREESRRVIVAGLNALQGQNPVALQEALEAGTYSAWLTDTDVDTLRSGAAVEVRRIESAQREQINQQRAELRERIGTVQQRIENGEPIPDAELESLQSAAGAAGLERQEYDVGVTRIRNLTNRELRGQRPERVESEINRLTALGDRISADDAVRLDQLRARREAHAEEFRRNPGGFAASIGDAPPPLEDLAGRRRWALRTRRNTGQSTGVYTPEEVATRAPLLQQGNAARAELAEQIVSDAGPGLIQATARQVAPRDEVFQNALRLGTLPGVGRRRMRDALVGADAISANPALWDANKASEVLSEVAPALRWLPEAARAAIVETTRNLYGAEASRHGHAAWNEDAYRMAFHHALGADGEGATMTGGVRQMRFGRREALVVLPVGWTQERFESAWFGMTPARAQAASNGVPVHLNGVALNLGEFRAMVPVPVSDGRYILWTGAGFVGRRNGGRYMIDLNRLPPRRSR